MQRTGAAGLDTPMWLAHHHRSERHKCVTIAGRHVCRRCLVLYPLSVVVAVASLAGWLGGSLDVWVLWLVPIPLVIDWVAEHLAWVRHSPRRQVAVTALAAWPFGLALARHAVDPFETHATAAILLYGAICLGSWLVCTYRQMPAEMPGWEHDFEREEAAREARLRELAGFDS
ncbi:MAG: hypothetical protein GX868_01820 [Actinobacteria bacterium]|nr:hypothetical protein [Actinomycetota bacterium]